MPSANVSIDGINSIIGFISVIGIITSHGDGIIFIIINEGNGNVRATR